MEYLKYEAQDVVNGSVLCRDYGPEGRPYNETVTCPSSEHRLPCGGTDRGWHSFVCPSSSKQPTCQNWTADGAVAMDARMTLVDYDAVETTCRMDMLEADGGGADALSLPATSSFEVLYSFFSSDYVSNSPPHQVYDDTVLYSTGAVVLCFIVMVCGAQALYVARTIKRFCFGADPEHKDDAKLERSMAAFFKEAMPEKWIHVTRLGRLFNGLEMECLDAPSEQRPSMIAKVRFKRDCAEYMNFAGKIICLAFVSTTLIWSYHADDGTCQAQDVAEDCCSGYELEGYCTDRDADLTVYEIVWGNCVWVTRSNPNPSS